MKNTFATVEWTIQLLQDLGFVDINHTESGMVQFNDPDNKDNQYFYEDPTYTIFREFSQVDVIRLLMEIMYDKGLMIGANDVRSQIKEALNI